MILTKPLKSLYPDTTYQFPEKMYKGKSMEREEIILDYLARYGKSTPAAMARAANKPGKNGQRWASQGIRELLDKNLIEKVGHGKYVLKADSGVKLNP